VRSPQLALLAITLAACLPPVAPPVTNVIDLRYRTRATANPVTQIYRWVGSRSGSVTSRCKMVPSDSAMFATRANTCGGLAAWYWGVSRLLLEEASSTRFTPALRVDGRLRWIDLPADRCAR
jgi:hypothetical protein